MSSEDMSNPIGNDSNARDAEQDSDGLASKLSKELSNWRSKRSAKTQHRLETPVSSKVQSEPARTIKVRGHETLVIRKSRLMPK